jgi:2-(1,2-epoxy-1,2-dihydrophenyl)acetyl-CoA isomerase
MKYEKISLDIGDGIAVLTLKDPGTMNALSIPLVQEMRQAIAAVAAICENRAVRALLLTGTGRAFCSGADLGSMAAKGDESLGEGVGRLMREYANPLVLDLQALPIPVVAAVNGAAAGAGVGLALAADVTIAARSAYFMLTFMPRLGLVPDIGTTWHLPRLIGRARAMALTLLGDRLPAEQAAEWGLIWACVDDDALLDEAHSLASRLMKGPMHAALETREIFEAADTNDLSEQLEYEASRQEILAETPDLQEGVRAFLEKREPNFK